MQALVDAAPKLAQYLGDAERVHFDGVKAMLDAAGLAYLVWIQPQCSQGRKIWDGEVEVFDVPEFSDADQVFAWDFDDDSGQQQVTVAQIPPATTPENAVKAYIVSQYGKGS